MRFSCPSTHEVAGSDPHRVCLARMCYAFRFSQPRGVSFLPRPFRLCFTPVASLGFSLQRFVPLTLPTAPLGLFAPHDVTRLWNRFDEPLDDRWLPIGWGVPPFRGPGVCRRLVHHRCTMERVRDDHSVPGGPEGPVRIAASLERHLRLDASPVRGAPSRIRENPGGLPRLGDTSVV